MKNLIAFCFALFLAGCVATSQKIQTTQNKTWAEMFDSPNWSVINSAKLTENNKVIK